MRSFLPFLHNKLNIKNTQTYFKFSLKYHLLIPLLILLLTKIYIFISIYTINYVFYMVNDELIL